MATYNVETTNYLQNASGYVFESFSMGSGVFNTPNLINGSALQDSIIGGFAADTINGNDGNDLLFGNGGADQINGGAGNDVLDSGNGSDTLAGGAGNDTYILDFSPVEAGQDIISDSDGTGSLFMGDPIYDITGASSDVTFSGAALAGTATAVSGQPNTYALVAGGQDIRFEWAGSGSLRIYSNDVPSSQLSYIVQNFTNGSFGLTMQVPSSGGGGSSGGGSSGGGSVTPPPPTGGTSGSVVTGAIDDVANNITGSTSGDLIQALSGNDTVNAGEGADTVNGNQGDDVIFGNAGEDFLRGGRDNDYVHGNQANDSLFGDIGNDTLRGGQDNDSAFGGQGDDNLLGDLGNDSLSGDKGNDTLNGGQGNDTLIGGEGNDRISGDRGNDLLTGGADSDTFVFSAGAGVDTITDFVVGDTLSILSNLNGTTIDTFAEFIAAGTQSGSDALFNLGGGNTLTLQGVTLAGMVASQVTFF